MKKSRFVAAAGVLLCALGSGSSFGQVGGSSCFDSSRCEGSCIPGYSCETRAAGFCAAMTVPGTSGGFRGLSGRCGTCVKYVMGFAVTAGACGSGCAQPCPVGPDE